MATAAGTAFLKRQLRRPWRTATGAAQGGRPRQWAGWLSAWCGLLGLAAAWGQQPVDRLAAAQAFFDRYRALEESYSPALADLYGAESVVYVQFSFEAPEAQSVSVAGDFEGWAGSHTLEDLDGDGVWTGRIPLRPGVHAYMFIVDETDWITDPHAQRYADDGFGNRNAILAVAAPSA